MEIQLQGLLEQIKKDGIEKAEAEAEIILSKAQKKAQSIVHAAETRAEQMINDAEIKSGRFENSAQAAIEQAGRDLVLSIQNSLQQSFANVVEQTVKTQFVGETFVACLADVIRAYISTEGQNTAVVEVAKTSLQGLEDQLYAALGSEIMKGIEVRVNERLGAGFILKLKDSAAYYDFSAESISESLQAMLSNSIADLIEPV